MPLYSYRSTLLIPTSLLNSPTPDFDELAKNEVAKIESLISAIENMPEVQFIRNGFGYDSRTAATFLRRKFATDGKHVTTAREFVAQIASGSLTTGQPYLIRRPGRPDQLCSTYLTRELDTLESAESNTQSGYPGVPA